MAEESESSMDEDSVVSADVEETDDENDKRRKAALDKLEKASKESLLSQEMKKSGINENHLQLLRDVSGAFRPGVLTALVGVVGAGKTTLMDVLAGRKTGGYIEGTINISGYTKDQPTFARVSGYCEHTHIHFPHVTVYESILYSAWLRLSPDVDKETRKMFVEEVMDLIELNPLRWFINRTKKETHGSGRPGCKSIYNLHGRTHKNYPRLVTKDTVDENVYEIAKRKLNLDAAVLKSGVEAENEA